MVRDSVQLETAVNTISHEYLLEFTSEYDISEMLHPELPGPRDRIVDFPEGKTGVCAVPRSVIRTALMAPCVADKYMISSSRGFGAANRGRADKSSKKHLKGYPHSDSTFQSISGKG
nr:hypothetical protein [Tanacetum cinerariifolium]